MITVCSSISDSSSSFYKSLSIVQSAPFTIGITVPWCSTDFLLFWQGLRMCISLSFLWFSPSGLLWRQSLSQSKFCFCLFFFFVIPIYGLFAGVFVSRNCREFYVLFSRMDSALYIYHLVLWLISDSCTILSGLPFHPSCFYSYTLFALFCYIRILWDQSYLWLHDLHILFCWGLSIFVLTSLVLKSLFSAFLVHRFSLKFSILRPYLNLLRWDFAKLSFEIPIELFFYYFCFLAFVSLL